MKNFGTTLIRLGAIVLTTLMCSSCATRAVWTIGQRESEIQTIAVWTNNAGDIAAECSVVQRYERTARLFKDFKYEKSRYIGNRFIVASKETWERRFDAAVSNSSGGTHGDGIPQIIVQPGHGSLSTSSNAGAAFQMIPDNISREISVKPPDEGAPWFKSDCSASPSVFRHQRSGVFYPIVIKAELARTDQSYREWWGYPMQILQAPAVVYDAAIAVVVSPVYIPVILLVLLSDGVPGGIGGGR